MHIKHLIKLGLYLYIYVSSFFKQFHVMSISHVILSFELIFKWLILHHVDTMVSKVFFFRKGTQAGRPPASVADPAGHSTPATWAAPCAPAPRR